GDDEFARHINRFSLHVMAIALEEGFEVNARKTRIMRQGVRQTAAGLTLNTTPNISRKEYDRLKAILTNCVRRGPAAENREQIPNFRSHLEGKIAHVHMVNPAKGENLKRLFERIDWPSR
ncbi:MAG TPA: RNA-directed DNA polymerase, partial [Verrucomicrobiae bacterium]